MYHFLCSCCVFTPALLFSYNLTVANIHTNTHIHTHTHIQKLPVRDLGLEGTPHFMAPECLSSEVRLLSPALLEDK